MDKIAQAVEAQVRNDETQAQFSISNNKGELRQDVVSGAVDKVVNGDAAREGAGPVAPG